MKKVGKVWAYKKSYTIFLNHVHVTQTYNDFFLWSHLLSFNWYDRWHLNSWFWYFSSYVWYSCAWNFVVWLYIGIHTNKKDYTLINFYIYANVCLFILNMNNNKAMEKWLLVSPNPIRSVFTCRVIPSLSTITQKKCLCF